jgi:hypothetical protein
MAAAVEGSSGEAASRRRTEVGGDRATSPSCIVAISIHVPRGAKLPAWAPGRHHRAREEVGRSSRAREEAGQSSNRSRRQRRRLGPVRRLRLIGLYAEGMGWTELPTGSISGRVGVGDGEQQQPGAGCRRGAAAAACMLRKKRGREVWVFLRSFNSERIRRSGPLYSGARSNTGGGAGSELILISTTQYQDQPNARIGLANSRLPILSPILCNQTLPKGKEHVPTTTGGKESRHAIKPTTNLQDRYGLISMRFGQIKRTQIKRQLAGMQLREREKMPWKQRVKLP